MRKLILVATIAVALIAGTAECATPYYGCQDRPGQPALGNHSLKFDIYRRRELARSVIKCHSPA
jgi:hypothetical protein